MIRQLQQGDAEAYFEFRRTSLLDAPLAFASSPHDDRISSPDAVHDQLKSGSASCIFGAFAPELIGAAGLYRDHHAKASHKVHLWGMYVDPAHRGGGIATQLLQAVIDHARTLDGISWVQLGVTTAAPDARAIYERAGFELWGSEPDAIRSGEESVVEHHMALRLD